MEEPLQDASQPERNPTAAKRWWNDEDFPCSAPWWLRYPVGAATLYGAFVFGFQSQRKGGWLLGVLLSIICIGLVRELFLGIVLAVLVGGGLWALGAAIAALPVSLAIIIGAMIIANSGRR